MNQQQPVCRRGVCELRSVTAENDRPPVVQQHQQHSRRPQDGSGSHRTRSRAWISRWRLSSSSVSPRPTMIEMSVVECDVTSIVGASRRRDPGQRRWPGPRPRWRDSTVGGPAVAVVESRPNRSRTATDAAKRAGERVKRPRLLLPDAEARIHTTAAVGCLGRYRPDITRACRRSWFRRRCHRHSSSPH